jgi:hypothetical protein
MAVHRGPASLRPRCMRGGSPVATMPINHLPSMPYQSLYARKRTATLLTRRRLSVKRRMHSQLNWAILLCDVTPDGKTEYVLTGNSAGLRTVPYSNLSHRELRSSLRESYSFLSLPVETTMASSQGTQPSKMNKRKSKLAFIEAYRSLPCFFHHSHTHRKTQRTDKQKTNLMENLCCARQYSVPFFTQLNCTV